MVPGFLVIRLSLRLLTLLSVWICQTFIDCSNIKLEWNHLNSFSLSRWMVISAYSAEYGYNNRVTTQFSLSPTNKITILSAVYCTYGAHSGEFDSCGFDMWWLKQPFLTVYLNRLFDRNQADVIAHSLPWTTFRLKWFLFDTKLNIYVCDRWPFLHCVSMSKICCRCHYGQCNVYVLKKNFCDISVSFKQKWKCA